MFLSHLYEDLCPESVRMHPLQPAIIRKIGIITKKKTPHQKHTKDFVNYLHKYTVG